MLHWAVIWNDIDWVTRLIDEYGPELNYNLRNRFGLTAQEYADVNGYGQMTETLKLLTDRLGEDGNVTKRDSQGRTGLIKAIMRGDIPFARRQIELNANVNVFDFKGNTPLHYAAKANVKAPEFIAMLLEKPIIVSPINHAGDTPLHLVVNLPDAIAVKAAQLLIAKGASPLATNSSGATALSLAIAKNATHLVEYLKGIVNSTMKEPQGLTAMLKSPLTSHVFFGDYVKNVMHKIS